MTRFRTFKVFSLPLLTALVLFHCGCATVKVDWDSRVGKVTFDEIVVDMGPPDKQAKLQDGTLVAEWITRRASHTTVVSGYYGGGGYYPHYYYAPAGPVYTDYYSPDYFLRLTFGADGKLQAWKKLRR
jgi:hypothetical protein